MLALVKPRSCGSGNLTFILPKTAFKVAAIKQKFHALYRGRAGSRGDFIWVCSDLCKSKLKYVDPGNRVYLFLQKRKTSVKTFLMNHGEVVVRQRFRMPLQWDGRRGSMAGHAISNGLTKRSSGV